MTELDAHPAERLAQPDAGGPAAAGSWVDVLPEVELPTEIGLPALVGGDAVAVFRTHDGRVFAVSNLDPRTGASVIARGIVGNRGEAPTVASPLYKDVFDLRTGRCLDGGVPALGVYDVRISDGIVQVRAGAGREQA